MIIKERVKFSKVNPEGKIEKYTIVVSGRSEEELRGRIANVIYRQRTVFGAELR